MNFSGYVSVLISEKLLVLGLGLDVCGLNFIPA